ncbi:MAG: amidohydrolase, partial [Gemmatimonadota bacterium]
HLRGDWLPLRYSYLLQLATGVTSLGPAENGRVQEDIARSRNNEILAPRLYPLYGWGDLTDFSEEELRDPAMAPEVARTMIENGARQVYLNDLAWNQELFGAAATAVDSAG